MRRDRCFRVGIVQFTGPSTVTSSKVIFNGYKCINVRWRPNIQCTYAYVVFNAVNVFFKFTSHSILTVLTAASSSIVYIAIALGVREGINIYITFLGISTLKVGVAIYKQKHFT